MNIRHILTPFNGMKSGFNSDGSQTGYSAQINTMKGIIDFTTQNLSSKPIYLFGYFQLLYDKPGNSSSIEVKFSLPANVAFTVNLVVVVNVTGSKFTCSGVGTSQAVTAPILGENILPVEFIGNSTGEYVLIVTPTYKTDSTTFNLTKIEIVTT